MATVSSPLGRSGRHPGVMKRPPVKTYTKRSKRAARNAIKKFTRSDIQYHPSFCTAAKIVCAVYGSTTDELAEFFRVAARTITSWMHEYPAFRDAVTQGAVSANMTVMQRLYRQALGFTYMGEKVFYDGRRGKIVRTTVREYVQPSETAQIFWLKNRMPDKWRDKHELSGPDGKRLAGDLYQLFNVQVSPDAAIDTYNKLLQVEARADVEFKKQKD